MERCYVRGPSWGVCSLPADHIGQHEAYMYHNTEGGKPSATWPNTAAPPPARVEALAKEFVRCPVAIGNAKLAAEIALRWIAENPEAPQQDVVATMREQSDYKKLFREMEQFWRELATALGAGHQSAALAEIRRLQSAERTLKQQREDLSNSLIDLRRLVLEYREARKAEKFTKKTKWSSPAVEQENVALARRDTKAARRAMFEAVKEPTP